MVNETSDRPRLTPKGERTRARIVEEAAVLIHERGGPDSVRHDSHTRNLTVNAIRRG
jgi:hypothetical protein